jgi:DNA polymerase-4
MNSYFASVEQQANPFLRNKPVGVCAYLTPNGCIIASSVEAKKLGIKTGCRVKLAKQICPHIALVENDPDKYRSVTKRFFKIMQEFGGNFEPYSIDEAFLDLSSAVNSFAEAQVIALKIQQRIKAEVGCWLKCSVGISFTRFLAKFASDTAGKDAIKIIGSTDDLEQAYLGCKLTDIWGIGPALSRRLNSLGITEISQLRVFPLANLMQALGKQGYYLWSKVNGLELGQENNLAIAPRKSIGHSYCLPKWTQDKNYLSKTLAKLVYKVGERLRLGGQVAHGFYINWAYVTGSYFGKSFTLIRPVSTDDEIFSLVDQTLTKAVLTDKVRFLAVGVYNLNQPSGQTTLPFEVEQKHPLGADVYLAQALDSINGRYGKGVIYRGRMWQTNDMAHERIGFRKLDDI